MDQISDYLQNKATSGDDVSAERVTQADRIILLGKGTPLPPKERRLFTEIHHSG